MRRMLAAAIACLALPASAQAAGMTTHAYMAQEAVRWTSPELRRVLETHSQYLLSGAAYPDSGYAPMTTFGEESHWERFVNRYVRHIRAQAPARGCGGLANPLGPCAPLIAHMMGTAAHGMGDETWDWLFEPRTVDHGEHPPNQCFYDPAHTDGETCPVNLHTAHSHLQDGTPLGGFGMTPGQLSSSIEYAMDIMAIADRNRLFGTSPLPPPVPDLLGLYPGWDQNRLAAEIAGGHGFITLALSAEKGVSPAESRRLRRQMPWSSANFVEAPGGVEWSARAIARYYEALWQKLQGRDPDPEVAAVYPADGAKGVPVEWPAGKWSPGPHTGGGENRIIAVLSKAVWPPSVTPESFYLEEKGGRRVPLAAGFPRVGPYGATDGTHSLMIYPAGDLRSCRRYTAVLTTAVRDWDGVTGPGKALPREERWSFRTRGARRACN